MHTCKDQEIAFKKYSAAFQLYNIFFLVHVFYTCKLVKCHHAVFHHGMHCLLRYKKISVQKISYLVADEKDRFQLLLTSPLLNKLQSKSPLTDKS